ncbi:MAG: Organic solvent tolerance protein OstA [Bacteroidetes bacterium]|nr:Organic solvent tolerance protein OstA [Bacteroidota bacterium]MDA1122159.1 Organic solvent tolerance protein OstA [Bacteroidota bacterium]
MRLFFKRCIGLLFITLLFYLSSEAQKKERIQYQADTLKNGRNERGRYRKLISHVIFKQQGTTVYCDSSYFYSRENMMEAYGHVKIVDDSAIVTSRTLTYDGNTRIAKLRNNVVYTNGTRTLYTNFLDYDLGDKVAAFFEKGKLVDVENTLNSKRGFYYEQTEKVFFYDKVELINEQYTLFADTLEYLTPTKIAYTYGPTRIVNKDSSVLNSIGGEYFTIIKQESFQKGRITTEDYFLDADRLFFDDLNGIYRAIGNVKMTARHEHTWILGNEGHYNNELGLTKVWGNAIMKKLMNDEDTFFLSADTLVSIESVIDTEDRILAYNDVKLFKTNLQGKSDSASYVVIDSLINFYSDPVLWNEGNQMESDTIDVQLVSNLIDRMYLKQNAFVISQDTLRNFNQVKGRDMLAKFDGKQIISIDVTGNGESNYFYLLEDLTDIMGLNHILCSDLILRFVEGELNNISFYTKPDATFIPTHELLDDKKTLDGFSWRDNERPSLGDVVYYYRKDDESKKLDAFPIKQDRQFELLEVKSSE